MAKRSKQVKGRPGGPAKSDRTPAVGDGSTATKTPAAEPSIFFRTSTDVKTALDQITQDFNKTQSEAIAQLILAFKELPIGDQHYVMEDAGRAAPLNRLQHLVADLQAANHSFALQRWVRAIEDHERLLHQVDEQIRLLGEEGGNMENHRGAKRFRDWTLYRLSFIWIDVAYERRAAGLKKHPEAAGAPDIEGGWELQYELAIAALKQSIEYGVKVEKLMANIASFNVACVRSLLAQYLGERALLSGESNFAGGKEIKPDDQRLFREKRGELLGDGSPSAATEVYNVLVKRCPSDDLCVAIQGQADESLRELNKLYRQRKESGEEATLSWLLVSLGRDKDLAFVKMADGYKPRFDQFVETLEHHGDTVTAWCKKKLQKLLPGRQEAQ